MACGNAGRLNYLRVRGEYATPPTSAITTAELPPRARRILGKFAEAISWVGTTSACAENTKCLSPMRKSVWNYLRVRGEYIGVGCVRGWGVELPPRARRIRGLNHRGCNDTGTTSACAENTLNELGLL